MLRPLTRTAEVAAEVAAEGLPGPAREEPS